MAIGNQILASLPHNATQEETTVQVEGIREHTKVQSSQISLQIRCI